MNRRDFLQSAGVVGIAVCTSIPPTLPLFEEVTHGDRIIEIEKQWIPQAVGWRLYGKITYDRNVYVAESPTLDFDPSASDIEYFRQKMRTIKLVREPGGQRVA